MNKMLITNAGLAEIVNAEQSGTAPVVLSHVAFGTGQYTATADLTKLKSEFKRFDSVAGGAISDNMIHLTVHDNSADKYTVNEVGVFTASGTLFAVISQTTPIMEKSATSESMLAIDIALTDIDASSITVGDTNFVLNPATTAAAGIVELATDAEAKAGTDTTRAMTPAAAKAARDADANIVHRTGNETIAGKKTFTSATTVKCATPSIFLQQTDTTKGTTPASDQYSLLYSHDSAGSVIGAVGSGYQTNGEIQTFLQVYKPTENSTQHAKISIVYPADGSPYATAPTPAAGDNSTKIATTQWANAKFLPLAGGKMSGAIKSQGGDALVASSDSEYIRIAGGSLAEKGAEITLSGKDRTSSPGVFRVKAVNNDASVQLVGSPDGTLTWNGKNIVRSVNGTAADVAGNVAITSVQNATNATNATHATTADSATKATQDGTGKVIANTYLAKSGGAMTVYKAMYRDVNDSYLALYGGTGTGNDGAQLDLCGSNHSSMGGWFQLHARNADVDFVLRGRPDGMLLWDTKYVLNNSFTMTTDGGAIMLTAGTSSTGGAYLRMYGKDHSSGQGTFHIAASDGTTSKVLKGTPDGTLTWNGINMSAMSMPSGTYKDLTLGASGNSYTAPADGWVAINKFATSGGQWVSITSNNMGSQSSVPAANGTGVCYLPVKKGDVFKVTYILGGTTTYFRFIYAEGAKHLAS